MSEQMKDKTALIGVHSVTLEMDQVVVWTSAHCCSQLYLPENRARKAVYTALTTYASLKAENERYRNALQMIANVNAGEWASDMAQAALKQEEAFEPFTEAMANGFYEGGQEKPE